MSESHEPKQRTEAQRAAQAKAAQEAARKRKERPPTEAELAARERMKEGKRRKAEERRKLKEGNVKPAVSDSEGLPPLEPIAYPAKPAAPAQSAPDAPAAPSPEVVTNEGPVAQPVERALEERRDGGSNPSRAIGTFIKRGLGL